mgnify:FL=1
MTTRTRPRRMTHAQDRHALAWVLLALTLLLGSVLGWSARVGWEQMRPVVQAVVGQCVGASMEERR